MKKIKEWISKNKQYLGHVLTCSFYFISGIFLGALIMSVIYFNQNDKDIQPASYSNMSMVQPLQAQNDVVNLASPDLTGKEYLGDGVYRLVVSGGITLDFNVFNGVFEINGTSTRYVFYHLFNIVQNTNYTMSYISVSGTLNGGGFKFFSDTPVITLIQQINQNISKQITFTTTTQNIVGFDVSAGRTFTNYKFKIQIEQGSTATAYQAPKEPQDFYENMIYNNGYDTGHNEGYIEGFNEGLDQVFNPNNLMTVAEKKGRGTTGPATEYFGFTIPLNIKVDRVTILNLDGYSLKPLSWSGGANVYQGIVFNYKGGSSSYSFKNVYNEYNELMEIIVDESKILTSITIVLAVNNPSMPAPDFENMQNHMLNNLGVYINNKVITDNAIEKFKGIIEADVRDSLDVEYQQKYDALYAYKLSQQYQLGYEEGFNNNDAYGFTGLLKSIFVGVGSFLAIPILPKITIGAILSVPLVFGIIFFIIGKRKGD